MNDKNGSRSSGTNAPKTKAEPKSEGQAREGDVMEFLTATTGHTHMVQIAKEVPSETLALLTPLVRAGGGAIPGLERYTAGITTLGDGLWAIDISGPTELGAGPLVRYVLCTAAEAAAEAWQHVLASANDGVAHSFPAPSEKLPSPKRTPWLTAVLLNPSDNFIDFFTIAAFAKSVAVTIMALNAKGGQK
jgi:hypothetical protein